jgi:hypothetical protein
MMYIQCSHNPHINTLSNFHIANKGQVLITATTNL